MQCNVSRQLRKSLLMSFFCRFTLIPVQTLSFVPTRSVYMPVLPQQLIASKQQPAVLQRTWRRHKLSPGAQSFTGAQSLTCRLRPADQTPWPFAHRSSHSSAVVLCIKHALAVAGPSECGRFLAENLLATLSVSRQRSQLGWLKAKPSRARAGLQHLSHGYEAQPAHGLKASSAVRR